MDSKKYVATLGCVIIQKKTEEEEKSSAVISNVKKEDVHRNVLIGKILNFSDLNNSKKLAIGDLVGCSILDVLCIDTKENVYCVEYKNIKFKIKTND